MLLLIDSSTLTNFFLRNSTDMDLLEEDNSETLKGKLVPADVAKRNLDAVREALKFLGGKAFGANIVDYLCRNRTDMLRAFGGDKKRLRYCVNGLLSARVNATYFEKKVYKDNGSTKTEWMLAGPYEESENLTVDANTVQRDSSHSEDEDTEKDEMEQDSESDTNSVRVEKKIIPTSRRRSLRQAQNALRGSRRPSRFSAEGGREDTPRTRGARDFGDCFESINAIAEAAFEEHKDKVQTHIEIEDFDSSEGDFQTGDAPLTYRGMIKAALESMGCSGTFESISKFIGVHFKDQLINKAETWKHSIAGCLSVYFARKDEKDNSGKVIWTLEEPPKPKRRIRKRDRDDIMSINAERETTPRSISKRRKEEMILISVEQLEALEEENECLKLLNVKKREEKSTPFKFEDRSQACSCCLERKELSMKLTPCGHIFCGSIFCEASTSKTCQVCKSEVSQRLPYHQNGNSKILTGIFDTLASVVTNSSSDLSIANKSAIMIV